MAIKKNFNTFTEDYNMSLTDKIVGFSNTSFGGERKWSLQTLITNIFEKGNTDQMAKAWVSFSGTTVHSKFNVSTVSQTGQGLYVINFIKPMASNRYVVAGLATPYTNTGRGMNLEIRYESDSLTRYAAAVRAVIIDSKPQPYWSSLTTVVFFGK